MIKCFGLLISMLLLNTAVSAQEALELTEQEHLSLNSSLFYYIDEEGTLSIDGVSSVDFIKTPAEDLRVGALGKSVWLRFSIVNTFDQPSAHYLHFVDPSIHLLELHDNGEVSYSGVSPSQDEKAMLGNKHAFPILLQPGETKTYYVRAFSLNKMTFNVQLVESSTYLDATIKERFFLGLFYGGLFLVLLYSFFLLITTRFRMFAYYAGYILFVGLLCGAGDGTTGEFLHGWVSWKEGFQDAAAVGVANILSIMFMILFLDVKNWSLILYKISVSFMLLSGILSLVLLVFNSLFIFDFLGLISLLAVLLINYVSARAIVNKVPQADYYFIASFIFGLFILLFVLNLYRFIPYSFWTQYAIHIGYALNLIILSFGIGIRIYSFYTRLLKEEQEKQDLIKKRNDDLEAEVVSRTRFLKEKEGNLRAIIENNNNAIWLIDDQYRLIDFNSSFGNDWKVAYGQKLELGKNMIEQIPTSELKKKWKARFDDTLKGKSGTYHDSYNFDNKDHFFEIRTFPIVEADKVRGASLFSVDITDQLVAQRRLEKQNLLLKKVNQELDSFVYSASHDLKAPLASVLGLITLSRSEKSKKNLKRYHDMMESSILRLDQFIKDIIDYSRNARTKSKATKVDVEELIRSATEDLRYVYEEDRIDIDTNIQQQADFYSDPTRIKVIIRNLLSNALKYGCPKQNDNKIIVKADISDKRLLFSVQDFGVGIKGEHQKNIFDMFFRASETTSGTGLGLYIVKETVAKVKGKIELYSEYGKGCLFSVEIPNKKVSDK